MQYITAVIRSFRNKALKQYWESGKSAGLKPDQRCRSRIILNVLDAAESKRDLHVPGFNFHSLTGFSPPRYSIHVNGPWCITFEFSDGEAQKIDLVQYH